MSNLKDHLQVWQAARVLGSLVARLFEEQSAQKLEDW